MKNYTYIVFACLLISSFYSNVQSSWKVGINAQQGISFANRVPNNRLFNGTKQVPTSGALCNQVGLFVDKKSEKAFYSLLVSQQIQAYNTKIYETDPAVTNG